MARKSLFNPVAYAEDQLPEVGAVYSFQLADGRYGACRVLRKLAPDPTRQDGWRGACVIVAVTQWIGAKPPSINEPLLRKTFAATHHSHRGRESFLMIPCPINDRFQSVGHIKPTPAECKVTTNVYGLGWSDKLWGEQLLMQWEWDHCDDREKLLAEEAERKERELAEHFKKYDDRIAKFRKMTLPEYRSIRFFPAWSHRSLPTKAVSSSRKAFRDAVDRLIALGEKPTRKQCLAVIEQLVLRFNELQTGHDGFIETAERDDICEHLAELLVVLKIKADAALLFEKWEDL